MGVRTVPPEVVLDVPERPLFTKASLAEYLQVSQRTVNRLVATGKLRAIRLAGHPRFRPEDVEQMLRDHLEDQ
jgi:excisionase family DNA binding protein